MRPDLVLPSDYPEEILRLRAIDHLNTELDRAVMAKTGGPIRKAGLLIGMVVLAGYLDIVAGGFLTGGARDLYTFIQLAMMAAIVAFLAQAFLIGRRMQAQHEDRLNALRNGQLCALSVLNARLGDLQIGSTPALEPRTIVTESLHASQREEQAIRALQTSLDRASREAVQAPALGETVATAPQAKQRRIDLL
jgi:hypothetical protein